MSRNYSWDALGSQQTLAEWHDLPRDSYWSGDGERAAQAIMGALVSAEALALVSGAVPPNVPIGTAAHHGSWRDAPPGAHPLYRATHYWARRTGGTVLGGSGSTLQQGTGQALVALLVVGVAAIVAGAWYATATSVVRIWSEHAVALAKLDRINKLASAYIKSGKPIPQALWADLGNVGSELSTAQDYLVPIGLGVGGVVLIGGGIALASHGGQ